MSGVIGSGRVDAASLENRALDATPTADSIGYKIWEIEKHLHASGGSKVYPAGVTPVTLTSDVAASTFGAWVEVIPASTITVKWDPHVLFVMSVSNANRVYRVEIGVGGAGSEVVVGCTVAGKATANREINEFILSSARVAANARVAMRCMDDAGGSTIDVMLGYHEYTAAGLQ